MLLQVQTSSVSLQTTSLLWRSDINIKNWANYEIFWRVISFTRIDLCCAYLNLNQEALVTVNCLLLVVFLSLLTCQILILSNRTLCFPFKEITCRGIKLISTIFFIPILEILIIDLKYYFSSSPTITEYSVQNQSSGNFISLARTLLSLLFLFIGNWIFEFFCIRNSAHCQGQGSICEIQHVRGPEGKVLVRHS